MKKENTLKYFETLSLGYNGLNSYLQRVFMCMYGNIKMTDFKKKIKGLIIYSITIIFCIILCLVYLCSGYDHV